MEDINTIYYNDLGIAFKWKRCAAKDFNKIQLVFKNTGLFLTQKELIQFSKNIEQTFSKIKANHSKLNNDIYSLFLLEAPNAHISFTMTFSELKKIQDLITKTLFLLGLNSILKKQNVKHN
ncbi:hypothetical protein GCM10022291_11470 [Postechiella marina]|uniref:Uncharacterized protein n=1 Tax=Postechiella marina TaxID=943941 RepID=A0ABP8C5P0_9FLAO